MNKELIEINNRVNLPGFKIHKAVMAATKERNELNDPILTQLLKERGSILSKYPYTNDERRKESNRKKREELLGLNEQAIVKRQVELND